MSTKLQASEVRHKHSIHKISKEDFINNVANICYQNPDILNYLTSFFDKEVVKLIKEKTLPKYICGMESGYNNDIVCISKMILEYV